MTQPSLLAGLPAPRLLPAVIAVMAALLVLKSGSLVRASALAQETAPPHSPAAAVPAKAAPAAEHAMPPAAPPSQPKPDPLATAAPPRAAAVPPPAEPPVSDSERALLTDLRQRRLKLDERETALAAREAALGAVEKRLEARVTELTDLQHRIEQLEKQRQEHDEANWKGLVKLYESMKPREAATIFNDLDLPVLLPVIDRMKEAKAAAVIAAMQPDRARVLTVEIANRRTRANTVTPAKPPAPSG